MSANKNPKQGRLTTTTSLVIATLRTADDFLTAKQISNATKRSGKQVWAALLFLRDKQAVGVVIQGEDDHHRPVSYWYARPAHEDVRQQTFDEYTPTKRRAHKRRLRNGTIVLTKAKGD